MHFTCLRQSQIVLKSSVLCSTLFINRGLGTGPTLRATFRLDSRVKDPDTNPSQTPSKFGHPAPQMPQLPPYTRHHTKCRKPHTNLLFYSIESSLTLPAFQSCVCVHLVLNWTGGKVACKRESMLNSVFDLWYKHTSSAAGIWPRIEHSNVVKKKPRGLSRQPEGPRQSVGVHHPNSRARTKVWESMVKMSKKESLKRGRNG